MKTKMKLSRWMVVAALLSAQTGYVLAEDQSEELRQLKQQLQALDQKVKILERNRELEGEAAEAKAKTIPTVSLGAVGLNFSSPDSNFVFKIRGYIQSDTRTYLNEDVAGNDSFLLRRVRPIFEGTVFKNFEYKIMLDFGANTSSAGNNIGNNNMLQDAFINVHYWDEVQLQVGKFKEEVGLERLQSATRLWFVERGFPTLLAPNRDTGVQLHGDIWGKTLNYSVGYFNGVPDGGSSDIETTDDYKDLAARVFSQPFFKSDIEPLKNLGLGVAVTHGKHVGLLRNYVTGGQQRFFTWRTGAGTAAAPNVIADGDGGRIAPQAYYFWGPFSVFGEYTVSSQEVKSTAGSVVTHGKFNNRAWQVAGSYFLTGEENSWDGITVKHPFALHGGGWGAWEIVARIDGLKLDSDISPSYATASSALEATEWGVGLNWHLNKNVKVSADYLNTTFKGGGQAITDVTAHGEQVILTRVQLAF